MGYSPLIHTAQYLSTIMRGDAPRLQIIFRAAGYESLDELFESDVSQTRYIRRAVLTSHSALFIRHMKWAKQFGHLTLGDDRQPVEVKREVVAHFKAQNPCCVAPGSCRQFHDLLDEVDCMLSM